MGGRARTEEESRDPPGAVSAQGARGASPGPPPPWRPSLPQRRYLFPHVIHDAHEARQQFSFFSSSKFLLGLLLAALLHPGGCHPPSARCTPGAGLPSEGLHAPGTLGLLFTKQRGRDCGCSALLPARPLRNDKAWRPPQKLTGRRRRGLGGVPTEPEPGRGVCALGSGGGRARKGAGGGACASQRRAAPGDGVRAGVFVAAGRRRNFHCQPLRGRACPSVSPSQVLQI